MRRSGRGRTVLRLLLVPVIAMVLASCGAGASGPPLSDDPDAGSAAQPAPTTGAESILHHWQALAAIDIADAAGAAHHVAHIIELVQGDHEAVMRAVLRDIEGGRLHLAENAIQAMLADAAEPGLSAAMIHIQLALAAVGREDEREAMHHLAHFTQAAPQAQSIHGLSAMDALVDDDPLDAMLHLRSLGQLEAERLRDVRGCSGLGVGQTAIRDGTITLALILDEEWAARHGDDAEPAAVAVVDQAQAALAQLGIVLDVVGIERWDSPAGVDLHQMGHAATDDIRLPGDAGLLLVLTDQGTGGPTDGAHVESAGSHAIAVRHHRDRPRDDALVLVHEIGHLLDLTHADGTYMQARGFAERPRWSECQKSAVARLLPATAPTP